MLSATLLMCFAQQLPPLPTFKSGVNVVEVDVVVTDKSGRPVRGLRKEDFEVFEDAKPVAIETFSVVDVPEASAGAGIAPVDRSGTSIASNDQPDDGRVFLIVLDDFHVGLNAGRMAVSKSIARRLVERLGPSDQAAVITTSGRGAGPVQFTSDRARLVEAIDAFVPQSEPTLPGVARPPLDFGDEVRARRAMDTMSHAAGILAMIPHRRKAVLLVSQGLPLSLEDILGNPNAAGAAQAMREFILIAQRSNIVVYPVDPCGLELDAGCSASSRQNLRTIAEGTGGFAVTDTNAPESGVERMIRESGAYYLVGYYSPAPAFDGRRHRIKVRTRVPDVDVRARDGYVSPRKTSKAAPVVTPLDALIGAPIQTRGLTMRIVAIPTPLAAEPFGSVAIGIELLTPHAVRAARIQFTVVAIDAAGRARARVRFTTNFTGASSGAAAWTRTGSRIDIGPGSYQIKVAAAGAEMRGSVFTEVTVPKFGDDLGVGGLSLGAPAALSAGPADRLSGVLPLIPFATRDVSADADAAAQLPIRISSKAASRPLAIAATLVRPDGTTLQLDRASHVTRDYTGTAGKVYRVSIPPRLADGSYRLIVETTLGRAHVTRELTFRVTSAP